MAFLNFAPIASRPSSSPTSLTSFRPPSTHRVSRSLTRYVVRCVKLSPEEARKKELQAAEAAVSRRTFEESAVASVVSASGDGGDSGTAVRADGRYGNCTICGTAYVIPGLSHSLCPHCGWVRRPKTPTVEEEEPKLDGHHD